MPDEPMVGVPEVASYLNVSEYTVREYAKHGDIPAFRMTVRGPWRFYISEIRDKLTEPPPDPWIRKNKRADRAWKRREQ